MTINLDAKTLSRAIRAQWNGRATMNAIRPSLPEASAVIYDSLRVRIRGEGESIAVSTSTAIPPLPMTARTERVKIPQLASILSQIEADVRTELPPRFLKAYDEWASRDYRLTPMRSTERTPGPPVTPSGIKEGVSRYWGADARQIHSSDAPQTVSTLLYNAISVTLSTDSPHGELNGGIRLGGGYLAACFGTWLISDYSDTIGLLHLCEMIDRWARLRLDLPERQ